MKNKTLLTSILILLTLLITKLFFYLKSIYNFPYYSLKDLTNHISRIYFLANYGFHQLVPHWYNGFYLFESYLPAYFYLALPIYLLTKNLILTTIISIILIYILGLVFIFILGKILKLSKLKTLALYLFFFANPLLINYLFIGRIPELFAWVLFFPFLALIWYYKNHNLDKKSLLFIPIYSLISLTHIYVTSIASLLFIPLFLIKNKREKVILILYAIISLLISSFAWLSFIKVLEKPLNLFNPLKELLTLPSIISYNTLFILFFLIASFFYLKNKNKREKIFFLPIIILALLILIRIAIFIPLINKTPPNAYNVFFLLLGLILFLKSKLPNIILLVISTLTIFIIIQEPLQGSNLEDKELIDNTINLLPFIDDKFIILSNESLPHGTIMTYAITNYNLSTPDGEYSPSARKELLEAGLLENLRVFWDLKEDCPSIISSSKNLDVVYIISHNNYCKFLKTCNFKEIITNNKACLYKNESN